jgi:hypothetical protein
MSADWMIDFTTRARWIGPDIRDLELTWKWK